jgi:hypothetical protein
LPYTKTSAKLGFLCLIAHPSQNNPIDLSTAVEEIKKCNNYPLQWKFYPWLIHFSIFTFVATAPGSKIVE